MRRAAVFIIAALAPACSAAVPTAAPPAPAAQASRPAPPPVPSPPAPPVPSGPTTFSYSGELTQGGWIRGQVPAGTVSARLGEQSLSVGADGSFFAAFDRDAEPSATLSASLRDGRTVQVPLTVSPRAWNIERVNVARTPGGEPNEAFLRRREPELARIVAARAIDSGSEGWRQDFAWPARGRISGRFGSQRIYRGGEAGSYHSGLDIAGGNGTPYVAPADGVVVLAAHDQPFSLEGHLLIIDHGQGLNSAFLHSSELMVRDGERVRQGQVLGRIGATGRASGPHLHWSLMWRGQRLDPLLFLGPMP